MYTRFVSFQKEHECETPYKDLAVRGSCKVCVSKKRIAFSYFGWEFGYHDFARGGWV
jgi:hypothetical protein